MIKFNIKLLRLKKDNMSQTDLINLTGIRSSTLSALENNHSLSVKVEQINKLCKVLNCTVGDLIEYIPEEDFIEYAPESTSYLLDKTDNTKTSNSIKPNITGRDEEILTAYKNNPDVQLAVDRLLKIEPENNNKNIKIQTAYVAARSTDNTPPRIETGDFSDIINAPDATDEY